MGNRRLNAKINKNKEQDIESTSKNFPIVGIGASAGGLETFTELLKHLMANTGMSFVLVQHLDPKHTSLLTELLYKATQMQVHEVEDGMTLQPNHVYVIPPNTNLAVLHGVLHLMPRTEVKGPHMPIDYFFRSLAEDQGSEAIGVVLSGTGSDGTHGLKTIKGEGGITFAQSPESAKYDGMPRSAVNAGVADFVLAPEGIAKELAIIGKHPYIISGEAVEVMPEEDGDILKKIFILLRSVTGVDFTNYKQSTVKRRIARRMVLFKLEKPENYFEYLQKNPEEVQTLYDDILIPVTNYFREPEAFEQLKTDIFPNISKDKTPEIPIRVWVPGCSTGEEAYSIAIALLEFLETELVKPSIQIFATDISEKAIEKARRGRYPESISADVSPERLRRFFSPVEGGYEINRTIREMCVFAKHDLTRDPPFSRLDLISCRNVLIYFGSVLQKRVIPVFHYALNPEGFLLLGASETVGRFTDMFKVVDKKNKTYKKKHIPSRTPFEYNPPDYAFKEQTIGEMPAVTNKSEAAPKEFEVLKEADRIMLSRYTPAGVVVNEDLEIVQFRGHVGPYLEPSQGTASLNLLNMIKGGLAIDLRTAIHKAKQNNGPIRKEHLRIKNDEGYREINIEVVPIKSPSGEYSFMILFEDVTLLAVPRLEAQEPSGKKAGKKERVIEESDRELEQLRQELVETKDYLRTMVEEKEAANEELRAANEEIQSSNEELQSINEELETAKEELQSSNEELTTVNDELQNRNIELTSINDDLNNLLVSVSIPIVMLGSDLRIRRYTSHAEKLLNISPADVGRSIADIKLRIDVPDLEQMVIEVVDKITIIDREITDRDGRWYSLRIRPYKTIENKIDGAVITLVDIDTIKRVQHQLEEGRNYAEAIVETVREPLIILNKKLEVISANRAFYRTFKVSREETENILIYEVGGHQWNIPTLRDLLEDVLHKKKEFNDFEVKHDFQRIGNRTMLLNARRIVQVDESKEMILLAAEDITERKKVDDLIRDSEERFRAAVDTASDVIITIDTNDKITFWNSAAEKLFGYKSKEAIGREVTIIAPERYRLDHKRSLERYLKTGKPRVIGKTVEMHGLRKDGSEFPLELSVAAWETTNGNFFTGIIRDITERKYFEAEQAKAKEFSDALNDINMAITSTLNVHKIMRQVTKEAAKALGSESAGVSLREDGESVIRYLYGDKLPGNLMGRRFTLAEASAIGTIVVSKSPLAIDDTYSDKRVDKKIMEHFGIRSILVVPLMIREKVVGGFFFTYHTAPVKFNKPQIDFAIKLSTAGSLALENAHSYEETQRSLSDTQTLSRVAKRISQTLELGEVLNSALAEVLDALKIQHGCIYVSDENGNLVIKAQKNLTDEFIKAKSIISPGEGCAGEAAVKNEIFAPREDERQFVCMESKSLLGLDCLAAIPIIYRGNNIGVLELFGPVVRRLSEREREIVTTISAQLASALENVRLYTEERDIANTLQESLLIVPEKIEGINFGSLYKSSTVKPGKVGGDFYDIFDLEGDRIGIIVGDVSGKGVEAAKLTALVKNTIKAYAFYEKSPASILENTNLIVRKNVEPSIFVTIFFGILNKKMGTLTYCGAGHPPAIIRTAKSKIKLLMTSSPALISIDGLKYIDEQEVLEKGDILILYTDGVTEARYGKRFFGEKRLFDFIKNLENPVVREIPQILYKEVEQFSNGNIADDIAILTVSIA